MSTRSGACVWWSNARDRADRGGLPRRGVTSRNYTGSLLLPSDGREVGRAPLDDAAASTSGISCGPFTGGSGRENRGSCGFSLESFARALPPPAEVARALEIPRAFAVFRDSRHSPATEDPGCRAVRSSTDSLRETLRPMRGTSRIEGTRPVRSGLPPPPSSPANLDREETRAGFPYSFRGFAGVGAPRDARDVRIAPHYRSRSRLSISGGSVCADGFLVGVPFTLQWPPMAVREAMRVRSRRGTGRRISVGLRSHFGVAT